MYSSTNSSPTPYTPFHCFPLKKVTPNSIIHSWTILLSFVIDHSKVFSKVYPFSAHGQVSFDKSIYALNFHHNRGTNHFNSPLKYPLVYLQSVTPSKPKQPLMCLSQFVLSSIPKVQPNKMKFLSKLIPKIRLFDLTS